MAQARIPKIPRFLRNQNFNKEKDVRLISILGDSWTKKGRIEKNIVDENPRDYIDIRPHGTVADVPSASVTERITASEGAFVSFLSEGGYTLSKYLLDTERQAEWARQVPELSVLHVGACDLANTGKYTVANVKKSFFKDVDEFLVQWPILAKKQIKGRRTIAKFERQLEKHKWLIVKIPNWHESHGIKGVTPKVFKQLKKRANTGLDNRKTDLWTKFRAVLVAPHIEYAKFVPGQVHLAPEDQVKFNEQVLSVAAKVLCEFCTWTPGEYRWEEHKYILENRYKCNRVIDPRRDLTGPPFPRVSNSEHL